jgi:hypothetical protein
VPVFELACGACKAKWKGKNLGLDPGLWFQMRYPTKKCCTKYNGEYHHKIGHDPLKTIALAPTVLMMLREPHRRLLSEYVYSYDMNDLHMQPTLSNFRRSVIEALRHQSHDKALALDDRLAAFGAFPGIAHCQTKMILGRMCYEKVSLTREHSEKAILTMEKFAFVGDTDRWSMSMCVLARKFQRPDLEKFSLNSRPTKTPRTTSRRRGNGTSTPRSSTRGSSSAIGRTKHSSLRHLRD